MKDKLTVVGVVVALALGAVGLFTGDSTIVNPTEVREVVGAAASPEVYQHTFFNTGYSYGGYFATTTAGATRLTARDLQNDVTYYNITPSAATAWTLPASSTLSTIVPKPGMCKEFIMNNASASNDITVTAGTGWDIKNASGTAAVIHNTMAKMTFCRGVDTDIDLILLPLGI
jgi:hypothetical protein